MKPRPHCWPTSTALPIRAETIHTLLAVEEWHTNVLAVTPPDKRAAALDEAWRRYTTTGMTVQASLESVYHDIVSLRWQP